MNSLRIYVATTFPDWQDACVQIIKEAYDVQSDKVDDSKVKDLLAQKGLPVNLSITPQLPDHVMLEPPWY